MYNTVNPFNWIHYRTVKYHHNGWSLTDASLSDNNEWLVYSSLNSTVSISATDTAVRVPQRNISVVDSEASQSRGVLSVRFTPGGRELIVGTMRGHMTVVDIATEAVVTDIRAHQRDLNCVAFADPDSPNLIYSGSDDSLIKLWDRRDLAAGKRPAGAMVGHREGIVFIKDKKDGVYVLSNSKDQSMKLWDIRMALSAKQFADATTRLDAINAPLRANPLDYRMADYDMSRWTRHPMDHSLVTFRGHSVLRTLVRCHFSPRSSSDNRYVYSASADGKIYIWNLDATLAKVIDVKTAIKDRVKKPHEFDFAGWSMGLVADRHEMCVRDASWHPTAPIMVGKCRSNVVGERAHTFMCWCWVSLVSLFLVFV